MSDAEMIDAEMIMALVRHGETEWNRLHRWQGRQGVELNELGRRQAAAAASLLADRDWSWMITSPLERAAQTGAIIAERLNAERAEPLPIDTDDDLVERAYGEAEGMDSAESLRRWPDGAFPGMESDQEVGRRGAAAIRRIASERSGHGVVVAHGSLIRTMITELTGSAAPRILNGSVSLVARTPDGDWHLLEVNRVADVADVPVDIRK